MYRITGPIPAGNYIHIPMTPTQSMNLTGRFLYLIFRPIPFKFFVLHAELATENRNVVRLSISNLFKEFKATSTWIQIPFVSSEKDGSSRLVDHGLVLSKPSSELSRWTFLILDLKSTLSQLLNGNHAYLKTLKLCANVVVKGAYTSDIEYRPEPDSTSDVESGNVPGMSRNLPRDLLLPVPKGMNFLDLYSYVFFPTSSSESQHNSRVTGPSFHQALQQATANPLSSSVIQGQVQVSRSAITDGAKVPAEDVRTLGCCCLVLFSVYNVAWQGLDQCSNGHGQVGGMSLHGHLKPMTGTEVNATA